MRRISRLRRDQSGSILIIAAFGLLILVAMLSLAIDHGRNYLTESDMEAKLTAVSKSAGDEYIWWNIRRLVDQQAAAQHISPGVTDNTGNPDCAAHLLCGHLHDGAGSIVPTDLYPLPDGVKTVLLAFVQGQMRNNGSNATVTFDPSGPIVTTSSGTHYMLFRANSNDQKNFNFANHANQTDTVGSSGAASSILAQSGVSVDIDTGTGSSSGGFLTPPTPAGFHIVFSLDWDSKTQLSGRAGDPSRTAQVFSLAKAVADLLGGFKNLGIGLTLGNVPTDNVKLGLYDNAPGYDGSSYAGNPDSGRSRRKSRIYSYLGAFAASDVLTCSKTVMEYKALPNGQCTTSNPGVLIFSSCADEQGLVNHECDAPAAGSALEAACGCKTPPTPACDATGLGTCSNGAGACNVSTPNTCGGATWSDDGSSCSSPGQTRPTAPTWSDGSGDCSSVPVGTVENGVTCNANPDAVCSAASCDCSMCSHQYINEPNKQTIYQGHWVPACSLTPGQPALSTERSLDNVVAFSATQQTDIDGNRAANPVQLTGYIHRFDTNDAAYGNGNPPASGQQAKVSQAVLDYFNKNFPFSCSFPGHNPPEGTPADFIGKVPDGAYASAGKPQPDCKMTKDELPPLNNYWVEFTRKNCPATKANTNPSPGSGYSYGLTLDGRYLCDIPEGTYKVTMTVNLNTNFPGMDSTKGPTSLGSITIGGQGGDCGPYAGAGHLCGPDGPQGDYPWAINGLGDAYVNTTPVQKFTDPLYLGNAPMDSTCGITCNGLNKTTPNPNAPPLAGYIRKDGSVADNLVFPEMFIMGSIQMEASRQLSSKGILNDLPQINLRDFDNSVVGNVYEGTSMAPWNTTLPAGVFVTDGNTKTFQVGNNIVGNPGVVPPIPAASNFPHKDIDNPNFNAIWTPALEVVKKGDSSGQIPQNIPFAENNFDAVVGVLEQGYTPYNITGGMAANQCALLKWGTKQLMDVIAGTNVNRNIIYIGGFPDANTTGSVPSANVPPASARYYDYNSNQTAFPNGGGTYTYEDVLWFANSNVSGTDPGAFQDSTGQLAALNNDPAVGAGGDALNGRNTLTPKTKLCFQTVKSKFLDNLFIITDGDVPEAAAAATAISQTNAPGTGCEHPCLLGNQSGDTTTADCTAQLLHCMSAPSYEVRKR